MKEAEIQYAILDQIKLRGARGLLHWHTPNQGNIPVQYRRKLLRMGLLPGFPDLAFLHEGKFFGLELKADKGRIRPEQDDVIRRINEAGGYACVGQGYDKAIAILETWDILKGRSW